MSDVKQLERLTEARSRIQQEIAKCIIGQQEVVDQLLVSLFSGGHSLLRGVPGIAKTMMVQTVARALGLTFHRIQFTPDLMPSDITGSEVLEEDRATGRRNLRFIPGPVFANLILADEINRTPPKTQAALLQAMQERQVTVAGKDLDLPRPFFVLATENPIEQEGTYPLPEAQLDRFLFLIDVTYPSRQEEIQIVTATTGLRQAEINPVLDPAAVLELQELVRKIPVAESVVTKAVEWARQSRPGEEGASEYIKETVRWGAGPRAPQAIILAAKSRAALNGRATPDLEDIKAVVYPALRHRLILSFSAEAEGVTPDAVIKHLVETIK
jgi:MoxR-like ATPase